MKTQTIKVEGLPEGWKAVAYRLPQHNEFILSDEGIIQVNMGLINHKCPWLIVEKIQPRRIVLESSTEVRKAVFGDWIYNNGIIEQWRSQNESQYTYRIWREVKETDEDPYLKLNKKDTLELIEHIKLGGQLNPKIAEFINYEQPEPKLSLSVDECKSIVYAPIDLHVKLEKFIKENS